MVLDFGVAKLLDQAEGPTTDSGVVGTPRYLAPEQLLGGRIDGRTDVYATGLTLFEMIARRGPFDGADAIEEMRARLESPALHLLRLAPVSGELDHAVARAVGPVPRAPLALGTRLRRGAGAGRGARARAGNRAPHPRAGGSVVMAASRSADTRATRSGWRRDTAAVTPAPPAVAAAAQRHGEALAGTPYLVLRRIGQGGMGEIYEAEHAELGRRAALKVLHQRHHGRADLAARLREEARLLARLEHPNLVQVFDLGVTGDGRPWFAMPLLRGRDLRDELARAGCLPATVAAALAVQALDGLAAAHAAGFVHRDVKLENLFLEEDGTLKVLDFGVAKIVDAGAWRTQPGASPGTPRSMAPEQCAGGAVDGRANLYAVGLALYELTAGRGPFDELRGNNHALRFAHCERRPAAPSALAPRPIPPALEGIVARALAKSPADRFQTAAEMAAALRRFLGDRAAPEANRGPRRRRRGRRPNPWIPATLSALTVASFALGLACGRTLPFAATPDRAVAAPATR